MCWGVGGGVKVAREPIPIAMEMGEGLFPWQQHTAPSCFPQHGGPQRVQHHFGVRLGGGEGSEFAAGIILGRG